MYKKIKRSFDLSIALILLVVLLPLFLVVLPLNCLFVKGNPLFFQKRQGLNGSTFTVFKIKSMKDGKPSDSDEDRVTKFGLLMRKLSLDELPQLMNVVLGEMSLVGPRPLLPEYYPYYTQRELKRFQVRPGMTGLAQTSGRNTIGWDSKLEYDVSYVEKMSLWLDVKILLTTVKVVLSSKGFTSFGEPFRLDQVRSKR